MTFGIASPQQFEADLVAYDPSDRPVLVVEAKARPIEHPREMVKFVVTRVGPIPFVLLADPARLQLYAAGDLAGDEGPLAGLDTAAVLTEYDPAWADREVSGFYLVAMVDAWIRDLAFHWRSPEPPGVDALRGTGLLERLAGGTTDRDVTLHGDSLR